jgi:hypothetical protein
MTAPGGGRPELTPLERVEALYQSLVAHYHDAPDAELRAAAKLLLVALAGFKRHGGPVWPQLVNDFVEIARHDPERFERILRASRAVTDDAAPGPATGQFIP